MAALDREGVGLSLFVRARLMLSCHPRSSRRAEGMGVEMEVSPVWCSSKENEAGASFAGWDEERSLHECAGTGEPYAWSVDGESSGTPNQGRQRGMPLWDWLSCRRMARGKP